MHINRAVAIAHNCITGGDKGIAKYSLADLQEAVELLESLKTVEVEVELCHCSRPTVKEHHKDYNICTNPDNCDEEHFSRGMCKTCDMVRCDAFPGACKSNHITKYPEEEKEISDYLDSELKKGNPFP